jgi:hypothetical protein
VDRETVFQSDYAQIATAELGDRSPQAPPVVLLPLDASGVLDDRDAPLPPQLRPLPQHLTLVVLGETVLGHDVNLP